MYDNVNRPQHYTEGGIECIDAMIQTQGANAAIDFCVCNAFKYIWRHNRKNGNEDIFKAQWYINKACELIGNMSQKKHYEKPTAEIADAISLPHEYSSTSKDTDELEIESTIVDKFVDDNRE